MSAFQLRALRKRIAMVLVPKITIGHKVQIETEIQLRMSRSPAQH